MSVLAGLLLVAAVVLAACGSAPTPTEAPVVVATEAPTEAPTAAPTEDPAAAIEPIFAASGHADAAAEAFIHWDTEAEVPTSCEKCHSEAGFVDFIADGKVDAAAPVPNTPFTCTMCHAHEEARMAAKHREERDYVWESGACLRCHRNGRGGD